jgi:hypothetical protein
MKRIKSMLEKLHLRHITINLGLALILIFVLSTISFSAILFGHAADRVVINLHGERTLQNALDRNLMTAPVYYQCPAGQCISGYSGTTPTCVPVISYSKTGSLLTPVQTTKRPNIPNYNLPAEDGSEFVNAEINYTIPITTPGNTTSGGVTGASDPLLFKFGSSVTLSSSLGGSTPSCTLSSFDDLGCDLASGTFPILPAPSTTIVCADSGMRFIQNSCQSKFASDYFVFTWDTQHTGDVYVLSKSRIDSQYASQKALDTTLTSAISGSSCRITSYTDSLCGLSISSSNPLVVEPSFSGTAQQCRDIAITHIYRLCQPKYATGHYAFNLDGNSQAKVVALAEEATDFGPSFPRGYDTTGNGRLNAIDLDQDGQIDIWDLDNDWDGDMSRVENIIASQTPIDAEYEGIFEGMFNDSLSNSVSIDWVHRRMNMIDLDAFNVIQRIDTNADNISNEFELGLHTALSDVRNIQWTSPLSASTGVFHPDASRNINVTVRFSSSQLPALRNMNLALS